MKLRNALMGAAVIAAMPLAAHAQVDGLYVGAGAGYNILQTLQTSTGNVGTRGGWVGLGGGNGGEKARRPPARDDDASAFHVGHHARATGPGGSRKCAR